MMQVPLAFLFLVCGMPSMLKTIDAELRPLDHKADVTVALQKVRL